MFGCSCTCSIRLGRKAGDVHVLQRVVNIVQVAAQPVRPLDQVDLESLVGQRQRGGHAAEAAADDQPGLVDGERAALQRRQSVRARAMAIFTSSVAFSRGATPATAECTQEHWSRMLAISNRYGFSPASRSVSRNSGSCVRGVQEATTMRLSRCSLNHVP